MRYPVRITTGSNYDFDDSEILDVKEIKDRQQTLAGPSQSGASEIIYTASPVVGYKITFSLEYQSTIGKLYTIRDTWGTVTLYPNYQDQSSFNITAIFANTKELTDSYIHGYPEALHEFTGIFLATTSGDGLRDTPDPPP
jgi:hypothetical protein